MKDTNVMFVSNVTNVSEHSILEKDKNFLEKVDDYDALSKLYTIFGRTTTTRYYVYTQAQKKILFGENYTSFSLPPTDKKIEEHNKRKNEEYGYDRYDRGQLYPLIDEYKLDYGKSIFDRGYWAIKGSIYGEESSDEVGYWKSVAEQQGTVEVTGGGSLFTTYVKQELQRINEQQGLFVPVNEAEFPELNEKDPYYYIYQKTAGVKEENESKFVNKEAQAYLQKYTIYSAFEEVEQDRIINANVDENIFVDAGPGTGKTYTLMNKLCYMVDELDVEPESIMVLCFTNAAVAEIKKRKNEYVKNGSSRGLRNVDVRTFHSFAWWLINVYNTEMQDEEGWHEIRMSSLSYDGSIAKATEIIRKYTDTVLGGWEHFIVDEIQDLTDVRARLVLEIVKGCMEVGCGVTVLGDSCQAIYDYNQDDVLMPFDSKRFYKSLFSLLYKKASFYKLGINHRQTNALIELTTDFREKILNEKMGEIKESVRSLYERMGRLSGRNLSCTLDESILRHIAGEGNVCLLCRNNGQVLKLSSQLRKRGIAHMVNAYDHNGCFASWVGIVFGSFDKQMMSYEEFKERFENVKTPTFANAEDTWNRIGTLLHKSDNFMLGVDEMLVAIFNSQVDDPVFHNYSESQIIVSNIHKAKGREYNGVVVEKNFIEGLVRGKNDIGEYKTLYVAVTRPKEKLFSAHLINSDIRLWHIFATGRKRWTKFTDRILKYLEIRSNTDVSLDSYKMFGERIQRYIGEEVSSGDEIILRRSKAHEALRYDIVHVKDGKEMVLGCVSKMLIEDLEAMLQTDDNWQWPAEIRELYVTDVYTHLSETINTNLNAQMEEKVWNWVEFCGLGRLVYDIY